MREINVWLDGRVVATCADEIAARYEGQHVYSEGRKGGTSPQIGYTARYVMPFNASGIQDVVEVALGSEEDVKQMALHDKAMAAYVAAVEAAKAATAKAQQTGR